jgi:hypothetical protein
MLQLTKSLSTGRRILHVATFDVTSVAIAVPAVTMRTSSLESRKCSTSNCAPIQAESPETLVALAKANPPPRRRTSDHGMRSWITCH